jgi:alpha-ketoglutarate-dependent taurine dioxygenase
VGQLQLRDLTPEFGTEITGLDAGAALGETDTRAQLRHLFDTRGVLVFRELDIDETTQANLVRVLIGAGPLAGDETPSGRPSGATFYVSNKEEKGGAPYGRLLYHSDMMWSDHTFQVLSLFAVEVAPPVTPTVFASGVHGWLTLPDDLRTRVESLTAIQGHAEQERARADDDPDVLVSTFENARTRRTPIGLRHPRTGTTVLYVSQQQTREIESLSGSESEALLEELFSHLYRPDAQYEHDWRNGDLVAWDNIAIQHARPNVMLEGPVRTLRKVFAPIPPRSAKPPPPRFAKAG